MNRRDALIVALGLVALLAAPVSARTQQPGKVYRIAIISNAPPAELAGTQPAHPGMRAFVQGLKARGYVEGKNVVLERRSMVGISGPVQYDDMVAELVRLKADVIVVPGTSYAVSATRVARGVPIVMVASVDPVAAGLAQSLARPGGNVTGLTTDVGTGVEEKRLELFLELLPKARRIAFIGLKVDWENAWGSAIRNAASKLGVTLSYTEGKRTGFEEAFEILRKEKPDAFFVALSPTTWPFRSSIGEFTLGGRIPSSCGLTDMAEYGCLMAYGQNIPDIWAYTVKYVDRILKGTKPGDLPIEQPMRFELVVNLKTAKALRIKVPHSILLRADRVID